MPHKKNGNNESNKIILFIFFTLFIFLILGIAIFLWNRNGRVNGLSKKAATLSRDSIERSLRDSLILQEGNNNAVSDSQDTVPFRMVNYNIFGRWFNLAGYEGQSERLKEIPIALANNPKTQGADIITIEESWCPDSTPVTGKAVCGGDKSGDILAQSMKDNGWPYGTTVINNYGTTLVKKQTSGGSRIFSKWPILMTSQYVYSDCTGGDCSASKGAVYVRIMKQGQIFNVFGTHLQAWSTPEGAKIRASQLTELYTKFLPAIDIPMDGSEPILFGGDFNTDNIAFPQEVANLKSILHASLPTQIGDQKYSSDPTTNYLVGKDGAAKQDDKSLKCYNDYKNGFKVGQYPNTKCSCCPKEMLDYILYCTASGYLQPVSSNIEIIPLKATKMLTHKWGWCEGAGCLVNKKEFGNIKGDMLSDHYPVVANFTFTPHKSKNTYLDGCSSDNDCNLKLFGKDSCYCDGPNCHLDGKVVNGWKEGGNNKVNANCHFRASEAGSCFCRPGDG